LAHATSALRDEIDAFENYARPAQRLGQVSVDLAELDRDIAELKAQHEAVLGIWLSEGQPGERPMPSMKIALLEARRPPLARDVEAAARVRPAAEDAYQRAAERVREAQQARDDAVAAVAVEAARDLAAGPWLEALRCALKFESMLRGLASELTAAANRGHQSAGNAAMHISNIIVDTRRAAAVPHDVDTGRRLIAALQTNARAVL
jgi:hypothetical protein